MWDVFTELSPPSRSLVTESREWKQSAITRNRNISWLVTHRLFISLFAGGKYHQATYFLSLDVIVTDNFLPVWHANAERKSILPEFFVNIKTLVDGRRNCLVMMTLMTHWHRCDVWRGRRVATHWDPGTEAGPGSHRAKSGRRRLQLSRS